MARKRITLSFDNGPHAIGTPIVLDALARRNLHAWFFLVGDRLRDPGLRGLAELTRSEGHLIANHTLSHGTPLGRLSPEAAILEIDGAQELLGDLMATRVFRPNGDKGQLGPHLLNRAAVDHLATQGYTAVHWNCVPRDWEAPEVAWLQRALDTIGAQDWSLVVLHDHTAGTQRHLEAFLDRLVEGGCEFTLEFPPATVMLDRGQATSALKGMVSA